VASGVSHLDRFTVDSKSSDFPVNFSIVSLTAYRTVLLLVAVTNTAISAVQFEQ